MVMLRRVVLAVLALLGGMMAALACGVSAQRGPLLHRASLVAAEGGVTTITFLGHASFLIETPGGISAVTDFSGRHMPPRIPDIVTMNHAHSTHFTDTPDERIAHVLRGWREDGGPAQHDIKVGDVRARNLATNIRGWDGGTRRYGNSVFVFETGGLCIGHLGHLHHLLLPADLDALGRIDILMIAVDGGYTLGHRDAVELIGQIHPRIVLPMHYFSQENLARFLSLMRARFAIDVRNTSSFQVSRATVPAEPTVIALPGLH